MSIFDRVRSAFGRGPAMTERAMRRPDPRSVLAQLPLYLQLQRVGGRITPQQVSEIIRRADIGYMARLVDLANDARQKDCHLQSVLGTRENALRGLPWRVLPHKAHGAKNPKLRDRKIAEFCEEALRQAAGESGGQIGSFSDLLAHLTGGAFYGYAVAETVYQKAGGRLVPSGFIRHSARRFIFDLQSGRFMHWDESGGTVAYPGIDLHADYPGRFLVYQPRINGDVPCREGLVRPLMWAALFRNWDISDWLALAELAWKPWRTGKYLKSASPEDIAALEDILDNMVATGTAVFPETVEIMVEWAKNATSSGQSQHEALANFMGAEMSKAVLGQTLTTEQGAKGSQALGRVHDEVRKDIRDSDADAVAAVIRRDLIAPLVWLNFGQDADIPVFEIVTEDEEDLLAFASGIEKLRGPNVNLRIPAAWTRERAGIPEPDDADELLGPDETDVEMNPDGSPKEPDPNADKPADADPAKEDAAAAA